MLPARLIIVVAFLVFGNVSQVEASMAKATSLADLRVKFLDKLKEDSAGVGGRSVNSLQEMASALLQQAGGGGTDPYNLTLQTPVMYKLVNLTRELDTQLSDQILIQHDNAEAYLNNFSLFLACNRTKDECLANDSTTAWPSTTSIFAGSTTTVLTTSTTTFCACCFIENCTREVEWFWEQRNFSCSEFDKENRSVDEVKAERCTETWNDSYEDYLERDIMKLATLQLMNENCSNWTGRWIESNTECQGNQTQCYLDLNNTNLTEGQDKSTSGYDCCNNYYNCNTQANMTRQDEITTEKILAENRRTEWRAIKRIMCLSGVLLMNASEDQRSALQACIDMSVNVSHLYLDILPLPSRECNGIVYLD